jgi:molybdate transport repressor ModE-like protein
VERPTLRQLEALDAIAREGSFRAAARALGVSQVAISDHIKQLETRLGVALFDRARGGKATMSAAGVAALTRARIILADCDALVVTMRDHARVASPPAAVETAEPVPAAVAPPDVAESPELPDPPVEAPDAPWAPHATRSDQPITIGIHPSILGRFQSKVAAFEDAFPHRPVTIDYNCFVADRVALALSEDRVTMAYFYTLGPTRVFPSDYLWSERWSLYVGRDHPLAALEFVGRDDIAAQSLLTFSAANRLRPLVDACLSGGGLGAMPVVVETDDYGQLAERAREGAGVLPLFGAAAARIGASAGLKRLPFVDPIPAIEVRRVVHPNAVDDDEVQALVATLQ